jgi:hypothetical protein
MPCPAGSAEWPRSRAASPLFLTTAPVFAVAIMVAYRLELGLFRRLKHAERPDKPAIKIWGAAFASQGPLDAAHGAIHCIRRAEGRDPVSSKPDRVFCFCLLVAADLMSLLEDNFQST